MRESASVSPKREIRTRRHGSNWRVPSRRPLGASRPLCGALREFCSRLPRIRQDCAAPQEIDVWTRLRGQPAEQSRIDKRRALSEVELQPELDDACVARGRDLSK